MNNDKRFDIDLQYGQVFERKVADMLQNKKIEVKTERDMWKSTGNIVVEFESRGKPSGIASTEAEYWFHNLAIGEEIVMTLVFPTKHSGIILLITILEWFVVVITTLLVFT